MLDDCSFVRSIRFLFRTRLLSTIASRRIFKICAFAHQFCMHERNRRRANASKRERERARTYRYEKRNEERERGKEIVQHRVLFGLCKHLPRGVVYLYNDNCNTLMCRALPFSIDFIHMYVSFVFLCQSREHISSSLLFWSSVLLNQEDEEMCDDNFFFLLYLIDKRERIAFNS